MARRFRLGDTEAINLTFDADANEFVIEEDTSGAPGEVSVETLNPDSVADTSIAGSPTWTGDHTFRSDSPFIFLESTADNNFGIEFENDEGFRSRIRMVRSGWKSGRLLFEALHGEQIAWFRDTGIFVEDANLTLSTGQAIEDGSGNTRISFDEDGTSLFGEDGIFGSGHIGINNGDDEIRIHTPSVANGRFRLYDREGSFNAFYYFNSSSAPGILQLTNADLDMAGNDIEDGSTIVLNDLLDFGGDFSFEVENQELVLSDDEVELVRFPKQGAPEFVQGIVSGTIETPLNSYTQLADTPVDSTADQGDDVGYTFAVNSETIFEVHVEADGGGGIQNEEIQVPGAMALDKTQGDMDISGELTEGAAL